MIDKETLTRIAKFTGLKPFQQEKNYIQTLILKSIFSKISNELVLKGGTALAFFYGLNRFSEDLDFTLNGAFNLNDLATEVEKDLEAIGVGTKLKILEDNPRSFSFRIGAEGPLFTKEVERCFVRVEISRREKVLRKIEIKELKPVYPDISPFFVTVMSLEEILAEKIRTIVWRAKARDLYDVWFLVKKGVKVDYELVSKKLSYYDKRFDKEELEEKIEQIKDVWKRELAPVVIGTLPSFKIVVNDIKKVIVF